MSIVLMPPVVSGTDTYTLVDVDGQAFTLIESSGYIVEAEASGRFAVPTSFAEQTIPGRAGVTVRQVNLGPRDVDLPIAIVGDGPVQIDERIKALQRFVRPRKGPIWVRVSDRSDNEREIRAYASVEISEAHGSARAPTRQKALLALRCVDAFWRDQAETVSTYDTGSPITASLPRALPFPLASSTILASATIHNDGDDDAYPVWTISGAGSEPVLRNLTTGEVLRLATFLQVGEQVVADTRPRIDRASSWQIYDPLGANLYGDVVGTPSLWPLVPGINRIQIELFGATADASVELRFRRSWFGP